MSATAKNKPHQPVAKRPPETVMRLERMGSFHQSRLSFMRVLLRRLKQQNWRFERPVWHIDDNGVGVATYRATGPQHSYTLIAFSHDLPADKRSDRVIAEAWDATFTLFDGEPTEEDITRLSQNVPLQEAGRITGNEFVLSRANRSVRLFDYVIDCLARGEQPDQKQIEPVGYLMRTTAVYGSGKFGAADRESWCDRDEFTGSFQPELLSVWLIRTFTIDLVEHLARVKSPGKAVALNPELRKRFGVGNSTGLGMAPFLVTHPALIHSWINARETALSRVRSLQTASSDQVNAFKKLLKRALANAQDWQTDSPLYKDKISSLQNDLHALLNHIEDNGVASERPWNYVFEWCESNLSLEAQEQTASLLFETHGELVDELAESMSADEQMFFRINGVQTIGELKRDLQTAYAWTQDIDYESESAIARVWYVSEEKLEPRLGERFEEPVEPYEQPLAPGRDAKALIAALADWQDDKTIAEFLMRHPEHRHIVRRTQTVVHLPYAEIRDNTIASNMLPIDLLRCKLSFFGATKFDPRSDRWLRITMFQGAPFPHELALMDPDDLAYPPLTTH